MATNATSNKHIITLSKWLVVQLANVDSEKQILVQIAGRMLINQHRNCALSACRPDSEAQLALIYAWPVPDRACSAGPVSDIHVYHQLHTGTT